MSHHKADKQQLAIEELVKKKPLFEVNHLSISFLQYKEGLRESHLEVIRDLNLSIYKGEIIAVVGASGSGKSLLADAILGVLPENATVQGTLNYKGKPLTEKRKAHLRGKEISLIPQSVNALDPLMKTGKQVQTVIKGSNKRKTQEAVFHTVGLEENVSHLYPFELSGGMARRVLAATAMVSGAEFIIADEPTPGLDPQSLQEIITYLRKLADEGKGIMFITHDIETAIKVADKVAVFYAGHTVEIAKAEDFSGSGEKLRHPYTKALWQALPQNDFTPLAGSQPLPDEIMGGCVFHPRCSLRTDLCRREFPDSKQVIGGTVRCFYA